MEEEEAEAVVEVDVEEAEDLKPEENVLKEDFFSLFLL